MLRLEADYEKTSKDEKKWIESAAWFKQVFKHDIWTFLDGMVYSITNQYSFDIIRFENHLSNEFKYPAHKDGSIADFMTATFGEETTKKFKQIFFDK